MVFLWYNSGYFLRIINVKNSVLIEFKIRSLFFYGIKLLKFVILIFYRVYFIDFTLLLFYVFSG